LIVASAVAGIVTAEIVVDVGAVEIGIVAVAAEIVTANRANRASTKALLCRRTTLR
jgi:hypothetical protein